MHVMRYVLDHGWCVVHLYELHHESLAAAALGLQWSNIMVMLYEVTLWLCYGCVVVRLWLLLLLLRQQETGCYGCRASQERTNVSAVLTVPQVFFQPLSSWLVYSGFSKQ